MGESVIFNSPALLAGLLIVIVLLIFAQKTHSGGYILPIVTMVLSLGVLFLAFLYGASWEEIILVTLLLLAITIVNDKNGGEES